MRIIFQYVIPEKTYIKIVKWNEDNKDSLCNPILNMVEADCRNYLENKYPNINFSRDVTGPIPQIDGSAIYECIID